MSLHHAECLIKQPGVQTIKAHREQGSSTSRLPVRQRSTGEIFDEHKRLQTEAPRMKKQFPNVKHYAATHMYDLLAHTHKVTNPRFQTVAMPRGSQPITVVTGVTTARGSETERETARTERSARTHRTSRETVTRPTIAAVTGNSTARSSARKSLTRTTSAPVFHYSDAPLVVEAAPTIKLKSATGATLTYTLVPTTSEPVAAPAPAPAPVAQARGSAPAPVAAAQQRVNEAAAAQRAAANQQSATEKAASEQRREERAASRAEHSAMVSTVKRKIRERSDDVLRDSFGRMLVDHETLAPVTVSEFLQKQKERSRSSLKQSKDDSHLAAAIGYGKRHRNYTAYVAGVDKIDEPHLKEGHYHKPTQAEHDTKLYTVKHNTLFSPRDYQVPMTIAPAGSNRVLATTSARGSSTARVAATITKSTPRTASGCAVGGSASGRPASASATTSASIRKFNDDPPSSYRAGAAALGYGKRHRHYNAYVRATA